MFSVCFAFALRTVVQHYLIQLASMIHTRGICATCIASHTIREHCTGRNELAAKMRLHVQASRAMQDWSQRQAVRTSNLSELSIEHRTCLIR